LKIFLDMDGVLTDFRKAVQALGEEPALGLAPDASGPVKQVMYDAIEKAGEPFWSQMPWKEDGQKLWEVFKKYDPVILSAPGLFTAAKSGKLQWIRDNIPGTPIYFSDSKSEFVDRYETSILIDDMKNNVEAWKEVGGVGILHTDADATEKEFLEKLWKTPEFYPQKGQPQ
jgi:hypothetical protein